MLFTSSSYLGFLSLITILYWLIPYRFRWVLLLSASFVFYTIINPLYSPLLLSLALLNYVWGIWIDNQSIDNKRNLILIWGIVINVSCLFVFKYFNSLAEFILPSIYQIKSTGSFLLSIIVPLGISFYTFTNISYLIEVKRRKICAEKHFGYFACYVSFFPKLIQGPIERPQKFIQQIYTKNDFNYQFAVSGMRLILWGFFKKLVIADKLATSVSMVYDNFADKTGPQIITATILYAIQIYMDFSAYTDIAMGSARLLGFELSPNFKRPYASKSIKEFWTRWHITLSNWLRDYVFLPSAFFLSRHLKKDHYLYIRTDKIIYSLAITLTFLICGAWHGVGLNFLVWGALYALYLIVAQLIARSKNRFYKKIGFSGLHLLFNIYQISITFTLVCFAFIFFRAENMKVAMLLLSKLGTGWIWNSLDPQVLRSMVKILFFVIIVDVVENYRSTKWSIRFLRFPFILRWFVYFALIIIILEFGQFGNSLFVYFQF
jgi:alginate O-acetyltransferase complex protein AlgI